MFSFVCLLSVLECRPRGVRWDSACSFLNSPWWWVCNGHGSGCLCVVSSRLDNSEHKFSAHRFNAEVSLLRLTLYIIVVDCVLMSRCMSVCVPREKVNKQLPLIIERGVKASSFSGINISGLSYLFYALVLRRSFI